MVLFIAKNIHGTALKFSENHPKKWCIIHNVASSELATPFSGRGGVIPVIFLGSLLDL